MITNVQITRSALKALEKTPQYIQEKFRSWLVAINKAGLEETRKRPGWHDEPLSGNRKGERSIRLNKLSVLLKVKGKLNLSKLRR